MTTNDSFSDFGFHNPSQHFGSDSRQVLHILRLVRPNKVNLWWIMPLQEKCENCGDLSHSLSKSLRNPWEDMISLGLLEKAHRVTSSPVINPISLWSPQTKGLISPFLFLFSLELFIAQYHIWLSADTHGMYASGIPIFRRYRPPQRRGQTACLLSATG